MCPVAVRVWPKSLSSSGLSSAELAPSAIPIERAIPQSGRLLKVIGSSKWCSEQQPVSKEQCTVGRRDRTCIRRTRSCAIHVQTDIYIQYIYKYRGILNRLRLSAFARYARTAQQLLLLQYMTYAVYVYK